MAGFYEVAVTLQVDPDDKPWSKIIERKCNSDAMPVALVKIDSNTTDLSTVKAYIMAKLFVAHKSPAAVFVSDPVNGFGKSLESWLQHVQQFVHDRYSVPPPAGLEAGTAKVSGLASLVKLHVQPVSSGNRAATSAAAGDSSTGGATSSRGGGTRPKDQLVHASVVK